MLSWMRHKGGKALLWLAVIVVFLALGAGGTFAATAEFYSWVTPSGEMVLTDDSGRIPPARVRGPVSVHRYQEASSQSSNRSLPPSGNPRPNLISRESQFKDGTDGERFDLMDLMLAPEQGIAADENSTPFAPATYVGAGPMYGYWSNQRGVNPSASLVRYLDRLQTLIPASSRPLRSAQAGLRRNSSGPAQSAQNRHALIHTVPVVGASYPTAGTYRPSSPCCTIGSQSIGGRRSAARR